MEPKLRPCPLATIVLTFLALAGCRTGMKMERDELERVGPEEGLVVGSFQVKGGKDIFGSTSWKLVAEKDDDSWLPISTSRDYTIRGEGGKDEEVFVTKLEAGEYHFYQLVKTGFSDAAATIHVPFQVQAGKTVYLGRLVVEFPDGIVHVGTRISIEVQDDKPACLARARSEYGLPLEDVSTALMTVP